MNELLLTDMEVCKAFCGDEYCMQEDMFPCLRMNSYRNIAQAQLEKILNADFVQLDKNQNLPEIPSFSYDKLEDIPLLQRGAINYSKLLTGFRKMRIGSYEKS